MAKEISERVPSLPGYLAGLNLDDKKSYEEKLKKISSIDPYNLRASFYSNSSENWPNIEFPDIVNYLLFSSSRYTNDQLKAYKSHDSGNFSFQQISPSLVSSHLRKLCIRKATGLDTVSARLLRECFDLISDSLGLIFNRSIETSIFPDEWKSARITPLYKKCGNRSDPSNYRPISIIPVVAKVFERIVYDQVYRYLTEYKLLCCYQSGFRTLHSTVTALIEATDSWSLNVDRGLVNAVVFLDLKKAFDTVNHAILLSKLQAYGIRDFANQWFCSYLRNRKETCLVDCNKSSDTYLPCGVPQGTILGPLLFLLYINDLPNCLMHSQPRMYADDTSITYASNDVEEIERCVNIDLESVYGLLQTNLH